MVKHTSDRYKEDITSTERQETYIENESRKKKGPILIVSYKNHSLDQFLEGCLEFCEEHYMIRVGNRSQSELLKETLLTNKRRGKPKPFGYSELRSNISSQSRAVKVKFNILERAKEGIVSVETLQKAFGGIKLKKKNLIFF